MVVADHMLETLGYPKLYDKKNPFDFMDLISLSGKTNFFERRVGEYQKAGVLQTGGGRTLLMEDDFRAVHCA